MRLGGLYRGRRLVFGGTGAISGTITVNGVQARKWVFLFERSSRLMIDGALSAADGSYSFIELDTSKKFYVVAFDDTSSYNAKTSDHLTPA